MDFNAKGLALFAIGLILSGKMNEAESILKQLKGMTCSGYSNVSWGYNFDWQARAFYVPVGIPNMVTTVFVANAFLDYLAAPQRNSLGVPQGKDYTDLRAKRYLKIADGACEFILNELVLFEDAST